MKNKLIQAIVSKKTQNMSQSQCLLPGLCTGKCIGVQA